MKLFFLPSLLVLASLMPLAAAAQTETLSASATNSIGGSYTLTIRKTGDRLVFNLTARSAQTSIDGQPDCESTRLRADGTFTTYCKGFGSGLSGSGLRYQLAGDLNVARIENVSLIGPAEFRLARSTP